MNWLEISLTIDGELAEAVTDVLSRHIQQGLATELNIDKESEVSAPGQVIVRGYLPMDGDEERLMKLIEQDLWHLRQIMDFPEPSYQLVQQQDWTEQWRQHYQPMPVGERILIVPAWFEPVETQRLALFLEPGMAFGTGTHPTTQLCIKELEKYIRRGDRIYDIGCGSGILSITSCLLGAGEVLALDTDPAAVKSTLENAELNRVAELIEVFSGSVDDLFASDPGSYAPGNIVVANILTKILVDLLNGGLTRLLTPGGKLILSGILSDQLEEIFRAAEANNLELLNVSAQKDWRALVYMKKELPPRRGSPSSYDDSGG